MSHDEIKTVTSASFQSEVLEARGPVVVEFMSYGCGHCGVMEPVLQQVAAQLKGKESIVRVNVGVDASLAQFYKVEGTPTVLMFLDGQEVGRVEGPAPDVGSLRAAVTQPFAMT
jgi:thioredoxin 1